MSETSPDVPPSEPARSESSGFSGAQTRLLALIGLLALMAGALWYDYKVARPAVEDAYERIAQLNADINARSGKQFMTNLDVQKELQRTPMKSYSESGYYVEEYGWRAGLPVKSHKYYAVYTDGSQKFFLKHYMNEIDQEELRALPLDASANVPGPVENPQQPSQADGGGFPRGNRTRKGKDAPEVESQAPQKEESKEGTADSQSTEEAKGTEETKKAGDESKSSDESKAAPAGKSESQAANSAESKKDESQATDQKPAPESGDESGKKND